MPQNHLAAAQAPLDIETLQPPNAADGPSEHVHTAQFMRAKQAADRRHAPRRLINRLAKIQSGAGTLPRDCLITDISTGGVRLHVEGYEVPDDFVLLLSGEGVAKECNYQVVWRLGHEVGARFVGLVRRTAARS
jgi:hypothetical protein